MSWRSIDMEESFRKLAGVLANLGVTGPNWEDWGLDFYSGHRALRVYVKDCIHLMQMQERVLEETRNTLRGSKAVYELSR